VARITVPIELAALLIVVALIAGMFIGVGFTMWRNGE